MNVVTSFLLQCLERCVVAAVAAGLTITGTGDIQATAINWPHLGDVMAGTFIVTLLACIVTQPFGDKTTPSIFAHQYTFVPVPNTPKTVTVETAPATVIATAPGTVPAHETTDPAPNPVP